MIDIQRYRIKEAENVLVLELSGRLDNETSPFLMDCIEGEVEENNACIVLDCHGIQHVSSMGLGTLVRIQARMKSRGGIVKLARVEGLIAEILKMVWLDRLFQIYPTVEAACESFTNANE
jgi:anti-sigma B factor antagonist